jgi:hypothetical protein
MESMHCYRLNSCEFSYGPNALNALQKMLHSVAHRDQGFALDPGAP